MSYSRFKAPIASRLLSAVLLAVFLMIFPEELNAQTEIVVYDGTSGINSISNLDDKALSLRELKERLYRPAGEELHLRILWGDSLIHVAESSSMDEGLQGVISDYRHDFDVCVIGVRV